MELHVIGTGSSGNCYLLTHINRTLMLDAGVPYKTIRRELGYTLNSLSGVLITHEHKDHCQALPDLVRAGIPIVINDETAFSVLGSIPYTKLDDRVEQIRLEDWIIRPFPVEHDAVRPWGFLIYHVGAKQKIVYLTDTSITEFVPVRPDTLIVECNYVDEVLEMNSAELGERYIRMKKHHFSLARVIKFLESIDRTNLKNIILVHLSATNSDEEKMTADILSATGIRPVIARAGLVVNLEGKP